MSMEENKEYVFDKKDICNGVISFILILDDNMVSCHQ